VRRGGERKEGSEGREGIGVVEATPSYFGQGKEGEKRGESCPKKTESGRWKEGGEELGLSEDL